MYVFGQVANVVFGCQSLQGAKARCKMRLHASLLKSQIVGLGASEHLVPVIYPMLALLYDIGGAGQESSVFAQLVAREPLCLLLDVLYVRRGLDNIQTTCRLRSYR